MRKWTALFTRYGDCITDPIEAQLRAAIREVFAKVDQEHPDAWIECGSDDGPLHVLSVCTDGTIRYTKYADGSMTDELDSTTQAGLSEDQVFHSWQKLIADEGS
jgi:hypothetical protein